MKKNTISKRRHRIKELLESLPMNTTAAKAKLHQETGISMRKIYGWYRGEAYISTDDQFMLKSFFNLSQIDELFHHETPANAVA